MADFFGQIMFCRVWNVTYSGSGVRTVHSVYNITGTVWSIFVDQLLAAVASFGV